MYVIYKTINKLNNKDYIGYHKTDDLFDDYLGSGVLLKKAILKYGRQSFIKKILYVVEDKQIALDIERILVNEYVINDKSNYNLKIGGQGGWDYILKMLKENPELERNRRKKIKQSIKLAYKLGKLTGWSNTTNGMLGKHHSVKSRLLISKNNGMSLTSQIIVNRINDYLTISKKRGHIKELSNKWNISHTQVRRFLTKHIRV